MQRSRTLVALAVMLVGAGGPLPAQDWAGSTAVGVQVNSGRGKPIAGARVEIRYRDGVSQSGPGALLTDGRGRAAFLGLAPGNWNLEVSHPDHLSYIAAIVVRPGKKAEITASFLQATGSGRAPIKVKFFKATTTIGSAAGARPGAEPAAVPGPESAPPREEVAPEPAPAPPEPDRAEQPAPPPPAPEPVPEPAIESAPEPATRPATESVAPPAATRPQVQPPPEPQPSEPEPEAQATRLPPVEVPAPAGAPVPEPAGPPAPAPGSQPERTEVGPFPAPAEPAEPEPLPAPAPEQAPAPVAVAPTEAAAPEEDAEPLPPAQPALVEPAEAPRPAPTPEPEAAAPEEDAEPVPPAQPAEAPRPAPTPEPEQAAPEEDAEPLPPAQPALVEPAEAPRPAPAPEPEQAAAEPEETTALYDEAEPEPAPAPRRDLALPPAPPLRSFGDRTCPECKPGEWSATAEALLPPGSAGCGGRRPDPAGAMRALAGAEAPGLESFAGQAQGAVRPTALELLGPEARREVDNLLDTYGSDDSGCRLLAVALPAGARFVGFRFEAADAAGAADCLGGEECPIGQAKWLDNPRIERGSAVTVIWAMFENRSPDRGRRARLTAYFEPGSRWRPDR